MKPLFNIKNSLILSVKEEKKYSLELATLYIKDALEEMLRSGISDKGLSIEESEKRKNRKDKIKVALDKCTYGNPPMKGYVRDYIQDLLSSNYGINEKNIEQLIPFSSSELLTVRDKFEILLHKYTKLYKYDALVELFKKHHFIDEIKKVNGEDYYCVTNGDIDKTYQKENVILKTKFR